MRRARRRLDLSLGLSLDLSLVGSCPLHNRHQLHSPSPNVCCAHQALLESRTIGAVVVLIPTPRA